ncbi:Hypothetical predicted protein [Olea europaea subsp. europaea]|uniref:Uncharacterized protein n=1 Tax=Olea europaea subsp. europaea TaxID=158383 RepID=A0A8S0THW9_OLEEU|nr:Hypothetical predicted protein [Olea europaea subsp. europaea]
METLSIVVDLDLFFSYPWGRISYGRLIRGFRGCWVRKFSDAMEKKEKAVPIVVQIWAFEAAPKIGDRFDRRLGERSPRLLDWTSIKQPQQRTYDAFFKNVQAKFYVTSTFSFVPFVIVACGEFLTTMCMLQLHVYATLRPTEAERGQPHITTLMPFHDRPVPALDDLARDSVAPQFHAERLGTHEEGTSENETSDEAHEGSGTSGKEEESGAYDSGEAEGEDSEDHDSGDNNGDRVRRSGQTGTFSTPTYIELLLPCRHHPPLMLDQLQWLDRASR